MILVLSVGTGPPGCRLKGTDGTDGTDEVAPSSPAGAGFDSATPSAELRRGKGGESRAVF